jgi:hypothetical protein
VEPGTDSPGAGPTDPSAGAVRYSERLSTPWWWYLVAIGIAALFAAEFHVAGIKVTAWLPFALMLPLAAVIVWWLGRSRVEVSGGELRIRGAHLPLTYVTGAIGLDAPTLRRVVGREGDPAAFVSIRPWIGPGVQVWIDDEEDPTPYWVVSTRRPDRLVDALRSAS